MAYPERFWNDCSNKQRRVACFALLRNGAFESVNMHIVITLLSRFMQCWNNLHLHIQKGFKQLLVISSRDTSAGIFFCGHCAVAQPWHHSSSSEFSHALTHQSNGLFRNEINTLKANLSVWCSLSGLVTLSSLSSKAVCVKKSTSEDKHAAGRPRLTLCHYRFSFVHTYQLVQGGKKNKKYARKGAFREEHKARVIHNSVVAEHRFACAGSDRGLLMSCGSGAQNKPLFPSLRAIGIMSVWRFELLPSHTTRCYDLLSQWYMEIPKCSFMAESWTIISKQKRHWTWDISSNIALYGTGHRG